MSREALITSHLKLAHHLDEHIIGQERAKKILSVAVFNHYHRVTTLLNRSAEDDSGSNPDGAQSEWDAEDVGTQFTGSTVATATTTPKPRRRRSDSSSAKDASNSKEVIDDGFIDAQQYERERRSDPTLIHSPEEWSSKPTNLAWFETHSLHSSAQPGFYDKAFPPNPRQARESSSIPTQAQSTTLLGRLARGSLASGRTEQPDLTTTNDAQAESFADIRATNSPATSSRKSAKGRSSSATAALGGKAIGGSGKEEMDGQATRVSDDVEGAGWQEADLAAMDDVVIEKSNVLMM
jgi:hypothetical protein